MHFLIIGASGRTGQQIVNFALSQLDTVTALVREPSSMLPQAGLTIATGTPQSQTDIEAAINSATPPPDAIIIALASVRATDSPFAKPTSTSRFMTDSHVNVIAAMKKFGIKRIVTVSAYGVGDSNAAVFWPMRMVLNHSNMSFAFDDHNALESVVRESGLDWTLVRPVMLADGEDKPVVVHGEQGFGVGMMPKVTRKSVARFVVEEVIREKKWISRTPVIAN